MQQLVTRLVAFGKAHPLLLLARVVVVAALLYVFVILRVFWTPDTLFIALFILFVIFGQAKAFVIRFLPFIALLLVYDSFRGLADNLNHAVHYQQMISFDTWLGSGTLPTAWLQQHLWHGHVMWYDFYFYFLYTIHFVAPVVLAVIIWKKRDELYWPFVAALVGLSFAAFITYVLFPAAPPWMASQNHFIPHIQRISSDIWAAMGVENFSEVYGKLSPNEVAAVPSLHAAYPLLFLLFLAKVFSWRRVWWLAVYPISVWLGVVYLSEHYVFDVLLGILYALVAYTVTMRVYAVSQRRHWTWRSLVPHLHRVTIGVHPEKR
ncbi:MAG TPA: phosphatase PAP2 family protein [Candidatus Saccharimonadales bacterium]|nr:phosphatase PAP2 family protein [Candidatus Saccharimonadales bacterium]